MSMVIRAANDLDSEQISKLIYETVRGINIRDYNQEQVEAWAPADDFFQKYEGHGFVADRDGKIVGFCNLTDSAILHRFYVHKDFQGMGIGRKILEQVEKKGVELGFKEMNTEASITAKPFFIANGWELISEQKKTLRGMEFINYKMFKMLKN